MNEQIRDMKPGPELDAVLGKLLDITPRTQWWAMDRDEKGIFITFDFLPDAERWMQGRLDGFPAWVKREGCHIVRKEIYPRFSVDIGAAFEALTKLDDGKYEISISKKPYYDNVWIVEISTFETDEEGITHIIYRNIEESGALPEAICKAALLALRGGEQG
ncbi:hypothetical protein [Paenibacillus tyrfis]|uniref:hypothetical protein n=1 Tax=Paenibacillus tyrfis TaxID=1501230 RepID=UPI000B58BEA2|nr:hypothetical protein [Paenibacillus tyrfis]